MKVSDDVKKRNDKRREVNFKWEVGSVRWQVSVPHSSLFPVPCSLFTIHYSLFTIHYSLTHPTSLSQHQSLGARGGEYAQVMARCEAVQRQIPDFKGMTDSRKGS